MKTELGKISSVSFGLGAYQGVMLGIHFSLEGKGWGVCDNRSAWDAESIEHNDRCKWTEEDRTNQYSEIMRFVSKLLKDAKVDTIDKLKGIPIEATFDGSTLKEWRVLTEVL